MPFRPKLEKPDFSDLHANLIDVRVKDKAIQAPAAPMNAEGPSRSLETPGSPKKGRSGRGGRAIGHPAALIVAGQPEPRD